MQYISYYLTTLQSILILNSSSGYILSVNFLPDLICTYMSDLHKFSGSFGSRSGWSTGLVRSDVLQRSVLRLFDHFQTQIGLQDWGDSHRSFLGDGEKQSR